MDYRTLFIFDIVSLTVYTVAITTVAFRNRRMIWLGWFAASMLLELTEATLQGMMGHGSQQLTVLLPGLLNAASFFAMFKGFRWLMLREPPLTRLGPILLGAALATYTGLYLLHAPNAFAIGMAPVFVSSGLSMGLLLKFGRRHLKVVSRVTACVLFAYMCVVIYRLVLISSDGYAIQPSDVKDARGLYSLLAMMGLGACLALTYLWFYVAEIYADLARTACVDPLTGVLNRRALEIEAGREISRATRGAAPLALVLIDIDYFKRINDHFGHRTGDEALRVLVALLRRELREEDQIARIGGEEFVILLPESTGEIAGNVAERLRCAIERYELFFEGAVIRFTVSAGVTPMLASDASWESMLHRADAAMYEAKRSGRNRIVLDLRGDNGLNTLPGSEQHPATIPLSVQVPLPLQVEEHAAGSEAPSW
ncbi:MAG: GGDEF domain-containing protein [Solirubrobacteraceae bacterium]